MVIARGELPVMGHLLETAPLKERERAFFGDDVFRLGAEPSPRTRPIDNKHPSAGLQHPPHFLDDALFAVRGEKDVRRDNEVYAFVGESASTRFFYGSRRELDVEKIFRGAERAHPRKPFAMTIHRPHDAGRPHRARGRARKEPGVCAEIGD